MRATLGLEGNESNSITVDEIVPNIGLFLAKVMCRDLSLFNVLAKKIMGETKGDYIVSYAEVLGIAPKEQIQTWYNSLSTFLMSYQIPIMDSFRQGQ